MRFSRLTLFVILSAALYSGAAQARPAWYLGVMAGYARLSYDTTLGVVYNRVHDKRYTYALELGYQPLKYLAMEVAYHRYGHYDGTAASQCPSSQNCTPYGGAISNNLSGWTFLLVPQLPLGHHVSVFVDGGLLHWTMTGLLGSSITQEHFGNSAIYGAGVRYDFPWHVSLKASVHRSTINLNEASVGAEWRF